jgi:hypothetical protein
MIDAFLAMSPALLEGSGRSVFTHVYSGQKLMYGSGQVRLLCCALTATTDIGIVRTIAEHLRPRDEW